MIDYVLIGCDENPYYFDFWPIVSKVWKTKLNITPVLGLISDDDSDLIKDDYGYIKKFKKLPQISIELQTQIIRLFLPKFLNGNCLISDIDMIPLSSDYFIKPSLSLTKDNMIVYSSDNPECLKNNMYPMCYILSSSENYVKVFELNKTWEKFVFDLNNMNEGWYTDQKFLFEKIGVNNENVIYLKRGWFPFAYKRIDRSNWEYDNGLLENGYYIDSHLLRPYYEYKEEINKLIKLIL